MASDGTVKLPRVAITYCTQCKWMLRAGYFGQELLSTFGNSIGEIALIPATGGIFTVHLTYQDPDAQAGPDAEVTRVLLWDRKAEGGFPETKILKQRLRNCIEPDKKLGHSDTPASKVAANSENNSTSEPIAARDSTQDGSTSAKTPSVTQNGQACEDCK